MNMAAKFLISKDNGKLQIPYGEYITLMERVEKAKRILKVREAVLADLERFLDGKQQQKARPAQAQPAKGVAPAVPATPVKDAKSEKAPVEVVPEPKPAIPQPDAVAANRPKTNVEIPPIKKEIASHFNAHDESGRLLNVFKQYYTCLNDACGGTVRVTMKDGVCSLWNYDEWEEFAFVDVLEGDLRFALDPRYTEDLSSLNFCEVPRLLSSRRNLVCIQAGDLNKTLLKVLAKSFNEVGLAAS